MYLLNTKILRNNVKNNIKRYTGTEFGFLEFIIYPYISVDSYIIYKTPEKKNPKIQTPSPTENVGEVVIERD